MVGRKYMLPASLVISAISSLLGILPLVFIWLIIREFLNPTSETSQTIIDTYAWWAVGTAVAGIAIYFLALCISHLAAFRVEVEMRKQSMEKIVSFPLGFFDNNSAVYSLASNMKFSIN